MHWKDEGYLLSKTNLDENSIIINAFTLNHGKYSGKVYLTKDSRISKNSFFSVDKNFAKFSKSKFRKKTKLFFNSLQSIKLGL